MGSNSIQCKGGSADLVIQQCWFRDGGERAINVGGSTGLSLFRPLLSATNANVEARAIRVVGSVFEGGQTPVAFVGSTDCWFVNNTIVHPNRWVVRILQETTSSDAYAFQPCRAGRFINNLVVFRKDQLGATVNIGPNTEPASFQFAHNLWFASDDPGASAPTLPVAEEGSVVGLDPGWSGVRGDYSIEGGSPAAGRGLGLPGVWVDVVGRSYLRPPSIGAYEVPRDVDR